MRKQYEHEPSFERVSDDDQKIDRPDALHPALRLQQSVGNQAVQRLTGAGFPLGVIQRQPVTLDAGPIGDSMTFIDEQLARQFIDPEDPRLSVRVERLVEAVGKLTTADARQLVDRLRDHSSVLATNFQRLATASRHRFLIALRGRLPVDIESKRLGTLYKDDSGTGTPLVALMEIVPSTAEAGTFAGYDDLDIAERVAERRPTIAAIVFDQRMSLYRVFETGEPTVREAVMTNVVNDVRPDYEIKDWVNVDGPPLPDAKGRAARIAAAQQLLDAYLLKHKSGFGSTSQKSLDDIMKDPEVKAVQDAYLALIGEAIPFARADLQPSLDLEARDSSGTHRVTTASSAKINVDVTGVGKHGFQAALDPMSQDQYVKGARTSRLLSDLFANPAPFPYEPYLALTATAVEQDPLHTLSVLLHEESHLAHSQRDIQLYMEWTGSGSSFKDWLQAEVLAGRVTPIDAALALESSVKSGTGWHANTELLSEVEGFMSAFHAAGAQTQQAFLNRFGQMSRMWDYSDVEVQELAIRKLQHYYVHMLPAPFREAFDLAVINKLSSGTASVFFVRLAEFPTKL